MSGFHRLASTFPVLALACLVATPATAALWVFEGTHAVELTGFGANLRASASGTGVATINGSAGGAHLQTLEIGQHFATLTTVLPITDPVVTAGGVVEFRLEGMRFAPEIQGGVFAPIAGAVQNTAIQLTRSTMPLAGTLRYCAFYVGCNSGSLTQALGETINGGAIGTGVGGLVTIGGIGDLRISLLGAPWTPKTVSFTNRTINGGVTLRTARGFAHGPASLTSSTA